MFSHIKNPVVAVVLGFTTLLTSQVIKVTFYSEREKSDKFCSEVPEIYIGQVAQVARHLATGWTARVRSRVSEGGNFSSFIRVQTGPGVHSASYKMSTVDFP